MSAVVTFVQAHPVTVATMPGAVAALLPLQGPVAPDLEEQELELDHRGAFGRDDQPR